MRCEKIVVCGFSGAGKTSLLKELEFSAPGQDWYFDDLDQLIMRSKRTKDLANLISEHGWEKFRLWERQEFEGWIKQDGFGVLSLGGGALSQLLFDLYKSSRKLQFCYLSAPFEDCWERLHLENSETRPLVQLGKAGLLNIYNERERIFSQIPWKIENPKGSNLTKLAELFWERVS